MTAYFADLHIHIGRTFTGKPVKITAAKNLTLTNILEAARFPKGLDIVGVIDCHSPEVIVELEGLLESGELVELEEGGFRYRGKVTLIPGVEIEINDEHCRGPLHVLGYFPTLASLKDFSRWLGERVKNNGLSTQRIYETARNVQAKVKEIGGLFIPAHVFTPFKSLYGKGVEESLAEVFDPEKIDAIELGLSSNTEMADGIEELHRYPFVSNSDAHSLPKLAREYQVFELGSPDFRSLAKALRGEGGNKIVANYGLNPYLGKYYRSACEECFGPVEDGRCTVCGSQKWTQGVSERIAELATGTTPPSRPPYVHQVPLEFLPGLGPKTMEKLYAHFGSEMNILHRVPEEELKEVVKETLAGLIMQARGGTLQFERGGGGRYGKVK